MRPHPPFDDAVPPRATDPGAPRGRRDISRLLGAWRDGDSQAFERLIPLVYAELRRVADGYLRRERAGHSLDPTDLVHETYLRLADKNHPRWRDRVHFYAVAAQLMRRVLVDHARRARAAKRGGGAVRLPLDQADGAAIGPETDILALDAALSELEKIDPRRARVVELRYLAGLTIDEAAEALGVSKTTVIDDARLARAWLFDHLRATTA